MLLIVIFDAMQFGEYVLFFDLQWSQKSRALHAKGLGQVLRWLQQIRISFTHVEEGSASLIYFSKPFNIEFYVCICFFEFVNFQQVLSFKQVEYYYSPLVGDITVCYPF